MSKPKQTHGPHRIPRRAAMGARIPRREFLAKGGMISAAAALGMVSPPFPALTAAAHQNGAEAVYRNARIYTVDPSKPWAEAVAVSQGRLLAVGKNDDVSALIGKKTKVFDLNGAFVVPGFQDVYCRPDIVHRAKYADGLTISLEDSRDKVLAAVRKHAERHKDGWLVGRYWGRRNLPDGMLTKDMLDSAAPGRPILLLETSGCHAIASSKALEVAGISENTPQPVRYGFAIDKMTGEPNGYLLDGANDLVATKLSGPPVETFNAALSTALNDLRSWGVTGIGDTAGLEPSHPYYHALEQSGDLNLTVQLVIGMKSLGRHLDDHQELDPQAFASLLDRYQSRLVDARNVKWWADGELISETSFMRKPCGDDPKAYDGYRLTDADIARARVFDRLGYRLHFHTVGAGTTRKVLDIVETLRQENPRNSVRHRLSHMVHVFPGDAVRFQQLNLVREMSPSICYSNSIFDGLEKTDDESEMAQICSINLFEELGVPMAYGSAVGASGRDQDVMTAIEALIIRKDPSGNRHTERSGGPTVSLQTALRMVTINGAYVLQQEDARGSIEVGKFADMVVLSENLFDLMKDDRPDKISDVKVMKTIFEGETSYEAI